jgi:hypothetical protein
LEFFGGKLAAFGINQCGDGVGERAVEERLHHTLKRRFAGLGPRLGGQENVARAVLAVFEMALLLEDSEERPDGGLAGGLGQRCVDIRRGGLTARKNDVHNLALAPAEVLA